MREPQDDSCPRAQANMWYPTYHGEIYIYFALCIYITLYIYNKISDYWDIKDFISIHPISKEISRDRFQELYIRIQLAGKKAIGLYTKVSLFTPYFKAYLLITLILGRTLKYTYSTG
jgi:hypothetical protein